MESCQSKNGLPGMDGFRIQSSATWFLELLGNILAKMNSEMQDNLANIMTYCLTLGVMAGGSQRVGQVWTSDKPKEKISPVTC